MIKNNNFLATKKELCPENFVFLLCFVGFFAIFTVHMGFINTINTLMNTAYALLMDTVLRLTAICVLMSALASLFSEFGVIAIANKILTPLMKPLYGLPGAASVGVIATFLSDNPAILSLAEDSYVKSLFKRYQLPALTNLGTSFGMGLIVCTYMLGLNPSYTRAVVVGLLGAVIGSLVSTRVMLFLTKRFYGSVGENFVVSASTSEKPASRQRPVRQGSVGRRFMDASLEGGRDGVKMGVSIIPGVLIICPFVMMLTNGTGPDGNYTGAAYDGIHLLPALADKVNFLLSPLFGFSSPEAVGVPITALGSAGAATSLTAQLGAVWCLAKRDSTVLTAICMCWSGYLSTHVSMLNSLHCNELIGKAIGSHTLGGLIAGVSAHWIYALFSYFG